MQVSPSVEALKKMTITLENDLKALLSYFGENPDSPEAPKSEDFFAMICSFSSSLQKAALELPDTQGKAPISLAPPIIQEPAKEKPSEPVSLLLALLNIGPLNTLQTIKRTRNADDEGNATLKVPPSIPSTGYAAGHSVGRGDLDQAIRSMRDGRRRARPDRRPLSKMFVDGSNNRQSRIYE
jgi:diaphanous 1